MPFSKTGNRRTLKETFGEYRMNNRIEEIRNSRNIRQEDLAREMGVSRQTISSLENGRYNPSIMLAYKIAKYFGMSIEDVFIFEEE
jgi:putative transcriptional regulator